jgi:hypothetical protein
VQRCDLGQFARAVFFGPGQEIGDGLPVGAPRMRIADQTGEEFLGGEDGVRAGPMNDVRQFACDGGGKIPRTRGQ